MNRLRKLRQEKGLTLKELSQQLADKGTPLSTSSLIKYERGERKPSLETWIKLADFFEVPLSYLMGIDDNSKPDIDALDWKLSGVSTEDLMEELQARGVLAKLYCGKYCNWDLVGKYDFNSFKFPDGYAVYVDPQQLNLIREFAANHD